MAPGKTKNFIRIQRHLLKPNELFNSVHWFFNLICPLSYFYPMKRIRFLLALCLLLWAVPAFCQIQIMTFNIRYDNPNDGLNKWDQRKQSVVSLLNTSSAAIIGFQEALPHQTAFLLQQLPNYRHINYLRDGENSESEGVPIFYNYKKLELLTSEVFWLSETPDRISKGWDARLNRIVVYTHFKEKESGKTLHVFNVHFDHIGEQARENSAKLIHQIIAKKGLASEPVIVMGDFNCLPQSQPYRILTEFLNDSYCLVAKTEHAYPGTFNGFDTTKFPDKRIDYIFTRNVDVLSHFCIQKKRSNGLFPSDHFPILVSFKL